MLETLHVPRYMSEPEYLSASAGTALEKRGLLPGLFGKKQSRQFDESIVVRVELGEKELPPWFKNVGRNLGRLLTLNENWDSYGAASVDKSIVAAALVFLINVYQDGLPEPQVVPTHSGGVQLEWHTRRIDLEIEFTSPRRMQGYFKDHIENIEWEDIITSNSESFLDSINKLASRR